MVIKLTRNFSKFLLVLMGGWAEGQACADPGTRTPIGASRIWSPIGQQNLLTELQLIQHWSYLVQSPSEGRTELEHPPAMANRALAVIHNLMANTIQHILGRQGNCLLWTEFISLKGSYRFGKTFRRAFYLRKENMWKMSENSDLTLKCFLW